MITALLLGIILGFALSIAPGPISVAFMKKAVEGHFKPAFMIALGAAAMDVLLNLLAAFASSAIVVSLSNLFLQNPWLSLSFQLLSVAVLLVLGIRYIRHKHGVPTKRELMEQEEAQEAKAKRLSHGSPFSLGIVIAITNLATPTFFPSMVAAVSYLHAEGFLMRTVSANFLYAAGFGLGTTLWFTVLLRLFIKHRAKLSPGFINTMFKGAGATLLLCAVVLVYNVVMNTNWTQMFVQ